MTNIPRSPNAPAPETTVPEATIPETTVSDEETAVRCPYCDRPFRTERLCALHLGETHNERWTDDERAAYEAAEDSEADDLFIFHLTVVAALIGLYAFLVLAYMVVLGAG